MKVEVGVLEKLDMVVGDDGASGWLGKGKRNGSVCLGGNEQGPLDQKG